MNYAVHFSLWNLNTITGECYEKLYTKLHEEWFREPEVTGMMRITSIIKRSINSLQTF